MLKEVGDDGTGFTPDGQGRAKIQVIARAAHILRCLEGETEGLSLGQIAKRASLPRSTVQRIIGSLEAEGFVIAASPQGRVRLGPALMRMAATARIDLVTAVHPYLEALSRELDETVDLSVFNGQNIVFVDQVVSPKRRLRAVSGIGAEFAPFSCAPGKAILARLEPEKARALLNGRLKPLTAHTLTEMDALMRELERVREEGVAYDRDEHTEGISAVGAAIRDTYGSLAAVSVPVPTQRFRGREDFYRHALGECCRAINKALGGQ